ncbi:MAG: CoA-binding protein [Firmicutes bacterium]|nr:CoA-binding protein [Bacillota bacterium]
MKKSSREPIERFFSHPAFVVVGASRGGKGFGWTAYRELKKLGHKVFAVHREPGVYQGETFYGSVSEVPGQPRAALVVIPREGAPDMVRELIDQGVEAVWLQPGAESEAAARACQEKGVAVVNGWCIMMFAEPVKSVHRFHRACLKLTRRLPQKA